MSKKYTLFLISLLSGLMAFSQSIKLNGKVINTKNEPVPGATIQVQGISRPIVADVEGNFSIQLDAGKKFVLTVTSVGYNSKIVEDVEVTTGGDNFVTIVLEDKTLEQVVVRTTVRRESTAALINFQRNNSSLSSGLAADFIRRTPDKNTGEVLKRVSGASVQDNKFVIVRGLSDRYNAAMINSAPMPSTEPDKKAFSFDVIPSALIDNIIVNKTATPELSAEFAGGLVQIITKDVPSRDIFQVGASFGFNTNSAFKDFYSNPRGKNDWMGFDDGQRDLPQGFPGTRQQYGKLPLARQAEVSRSFSTDGYQQRSSTAIPIQTYNITYGIGRKLKNDASFGLVAGITYRNSKLLYTVDRQEGEFTFDGINRRTQDEQNRFSTNVGAVLNLTYAMKKTKVSFKNLFNQFYDDNYYIRTGHDFERDNDLSFRSSFLNQRTLYSSQLEAEQQLTPSGIKVKLNGNFSYNWKSQPDLRTQSYAKATGTSQPFALNFDETNRFFSDLKDYSYGGGGQLIVPFKLFDDKQTLKVGGSSLTRVRNFNSRNFRYSLTASAPATLRTLPFDQIFLPQNISENGFIMDETTQNEDKYFGVSALNAGYVMLDNKLSDKLRLIWGARVEYFHQVLTSMRSDLTRVVVDTEKWDVLPSLNLVYNLNDQHAIRLAGYMTVARPEFREIAPFSFYDFEQNYAVSGDTTLKRTSIMNFDARYEWYPKAGESISVGVFYKKFDDPIELRARNRKPTRYSYQNADNANTFGVELEIRKNLDFISAGFKNFSLFSNFTYINSKVELTGTSAGGSTASFSRPLQGQSPYLINVGLQYASAKGGLNASLLYNRVGQRLALVGDQSLQVYDIYERPRDQVDFTISQKVLNKRGEIKLNVADILNQQYYFYENFDSKKAFKSGTDRLFNAYKPGSTFTIGFTYDFIK